jgi:myo-inositol-1(or 4)-monophosphatase
MQPVLNVAISAARQAGEIILRYREMLDRIQIHQKGPKDLFSEVDVKAEQAIMNTISKAYPDHGFIAEESGVHHAAAEYTWLIDPLDGTNNYLHGYPYYCVSIALKVKDKIECAVILDPIRQECFSAYRGEGARLNDRRMRISPKVVELDQALIGSTFPYHPSHETSYHAKFHQVAGAVAGVRKVGAAALELAYLAAGRLDGFLGINLGPWDIAAASLLVQESGGFVSDLDGDDQYLKKGHILAANPKISKAMSQIFQG